MRWQRVAGDHRDGWLDTISVFVMPTLPALCIAATPTKRNGLLDLAARAEARGFAGLACTGTGGNLAMCLSVLHATQVVPVFAAIQPIYFAHATETAATAAHLAEVGGGRFRLGLGVSHEPLLNRLAVANGNPLNDMREYVLAIRANDRVGTLPPIIVAALRNRMLDLALEVGDGAMWANASLSYMPSQVERIPPHRRDTFDLSNMVPTVIDRDLAAARAVHRRTLSAYVTLPNYRNYWKAAGYEQEMADIEAAIAKRDREASAEAMTDQWVDDCTISGSGGAVRDRIEEWQSVGVAPMVVMSSTSGGQAKAIQELFDAYAS